MSEQVQVREGVWRTRDGREIAVRARDFGDAGPTSWCWCSESTGEFETWRDDGRNALSTFQQPLDLVEYVGPLPHTEPEPEPEPQPTSELQPEQVCEGLWKTRSGQLVEVRARQDKVQTQYRWIGSIFGVAYRWRDDGRKSEGRDHHCDLVAYVGPLPQAEPAPEPQPVQVRPGIWRTREGHEVEVRERNANGPTCFRWVGVLSGVRESWRDDGTWSLRDEADRRDLVAYAWPLPEQTTTDTLAEIEEQADNPAQPDGETWKALAIRHEAAYQMMEAKRDQLRDQLETMTSDRDRVQAELQQARIDLEAERQVPRSEIAISDAAFAGFNKGKTWAFREVCDWLRPFVGANPEDAAALLDAVPGLVKRLAQCEGVEI